MKNKEKKALIKKAMALPPVPIETMETIRRAGGFRTGSSVYGPIDKAKDIDWCVHIFPLLIDENMVYATTQQEYIDTNMVVLYGNYAGKLLNVICFNDTSLFDAWKQATSIMKELPPYEIKWQRVRVFRALLDVYWPVKPCATRISRKKALKLQKCIICGREAVYFSNKPVKKHYKKTGICERCSTT